MAIKQLLANLAGDSLPVENAPTDFSRDVLTSQVKTARQLLYHISDIMS
jgi:hypothetical protein